MMGKQFADKLTDILVTILARVLVVALFSILLTGPIKWAWNATMPYLFALPVITWGKAWCLYFLGHCLIKSSFSSPAVKDGNKKNTAV